MSKFNQGWSQLVPGSHVLLHVARCWDNFRLTSEPVVDVIPPLVVELSEIFSLLELLQKELDARVVIIPLPVQYGAKVLQIDLMCQKCIFPKETPHGVAMKPNERRYNWFIA